MTVNFGRKQNMWIVCTYLSSLFKRMFVFLFFAFFITSICFLQRHSFISGKREVQNLHFSSIKSKNYKTFVRPNEKIVTNDTVPVASNQEHIQKETYVARKLEIQHRVTNTKTALNYGRLLGISRNSPANRDLIDIMGQPPIEFIPNYKNPCFLGDKTNPLFSDNRLHCLPYFYLIGVKKSGTSDLFHRISSHPEFRGPEFKEAQWFPRMRLGISTEAFIRKPVFKKTLQKGIDNRSIKYYISLFDTAATSIKSCAAKCITGEATPANLHMNPRWDLLPGNEGLTTPRYTNFDYIKHITPAAKIIIIFRDPVTRLFSDFMHEVRLRHQTFSLEKLAEMFHNQALVLTRTYGTCFKSIQMSRCIFNNTLSDHLMKEGVFLADSFRAGFYAFYMRELTSVFGRNKILPILMTDYLTKIEETLEKAFRFLDMSPLSAAQMSRIVKLRVSNSSKNKEMSRATMKAETKNILYNFYKPFNKEMAGLMEHRGYLFSQA